MAIKTSPLAAAIKKATKPKVHKVPAAKEPGGKDGISTSSYYYPPDFYLTDKDFPGIADWKAGQKVNLAISGTVGSMSIREPKKGKREYSTSVRVTAISDLGAGK
jgi:hypothetical protein